ncbi:MAG: hypothetical protein VB859_00745, partial [Planctomycetaceae bacterium]
RVLFRSGSADPVDVRAANPVSTAADELSAATENITPDDTSPLTSTPKPGTDDGTCSREPAVDIHLADLPCFLGKRAG